MLSWLFKKRGGAGAPKAAPSLQPAVLPDAHTKANQAEETRAAWFVRLQDARGDDAALLRVAQEATLLEIKLAAVEALLEEAALKQAEREFRSHDRRVHRVAKRRLEAAVAQREARARAGMLIESARALAAESLLPANRLVALDKDWQALDASLLDSTQCNDFSALRERLNASMHERGEKQRQVQRWTADATRTLAELRLGCAQAAAHGSGNGIALCIAAAQALREAHPDAPAVATLDQALQAALQTATLVADRLALLTALDRTADAPKALPPDGGHSQDAAEVTPANAAELASSSPPAQTQPAPPAPTATQRWQALPPLADAELARVLNERFEQWQRSQAPADRARDAPAGQSPLSPARVNRPSAGQLVRLDATLLKAEAALAEGQLGAMAQHLNAVDAALDAMNGLPSSDPLRARHQALHAERARLKGWQHWGGGLAREALVAEAEELARLTLAAADTEAPFVPKLKLKSHADAIHALRLRWKELDRLGAAASQPLWQRFDAALQTAHQPVAAHQSVLNTARQDNLSAREALLATLEAVPALEASANADDLAAHWKDQLRALERFHLAWRQLGPLEHTVPAAARSALQQRLRNSVERVDAPLQEARRAAEAVREQLIVRAEALVQDMGHQAQMRDAALRVRELQAEWQQHARTMPLARAVEGALWARFKAATDAVFAQRDAAFSARETELAANLAAREALLERLSALAGDSPGADIQRTLAEVDRAWNHDVELPRGAVAAIEARFREARMAALKRLNDSAQERWQAHCDTLAAKLALCEERERASVDDGDVAQRWAAHDALPAAWEQALAQRWSHPAEPGPLPERSLDELLLQLEAALDLPSAPEWLAARRDLKLRAMKNALEGRGAPNPGPARPAEWFAAALRQSGTTAAQRERLHALIAVLRRAPPGSLASPTPRG